MLLLLLTCPLLQSRSIAANVRPAVIGADGLEFTQVRVQCLVCWPDITHECQSVWQQHANPKDIYV
jgi:hypothetical protein